MSQLDLEICVSNLEFLIESKTKLIKINQASAEDYLDLCDHFRNLACGKYLLSLNKAEFEQQLSNSVKTSLMFLKDFEKLKFDQYYRCRSRISSVLDAIIISDMQSLANLDDLLDDMAVKQMEYEEDFYFLFLLTKLALNKFDKNQKIERLEYFASLPGAEASQISFFGAILDVDAEMLEEAIIDLIGEWHDSVVKQRQDETIDPYFNLTAANLYITGLAMLKLASNNGMNLHGKIRYIPAILL